MVSTIILGLLSVILILSFSIFLGLYIQNKFNILKDNNYISYGLGFLTYIAIISILFLPIIFLSLSGTTLFVSWWVINAIFIFFIIFNYKIINLKNINKKQLITFLLITIFIVIITRYMGSLPKAQDNIFYIPWVKNNQYIDHINTGTYINNLNKGNGITSTYWVEGWYYFQTVLLRSTHMDQNFMNLWVFGFFTNALLTSSMFGIVYTITKKSNILFLMFSAVAGVAIGWFINGSTYTNIGSSILIWVVVLLFILSINYLKQERSIYILLIAIVSYAGWAISSSSLFILAILYVGVVFALLFKKSKHLLEFSLFALSIILLMLSMFVFKTSKIYFWLIFLGFLVSVALIITLRIYFNDLSYSFSLWICKYRFIIFYLSFAFVAILSFIFWLSYGKDPWLNFSYRGDGITPYWPNDPWLAFDALRYGLFWIFSILLLINLVKNLKGEIKNNKMNYFFLIVVFSMIFFFNPVVASLWNGKIIPTIVYHRVRLNVMVPMYISIVLFINRFKFKMIKKVFYVVASISLTTTILVPLFTQNMMKNVYSGYTGYGKGLRELGSYINNNNLDKEKMAGDINGIYAYVNNPLSFNRYTKPFANMQYTYLDDKLYNSFSKNEKNKIDILIKVNLNVSPDFSYKKYNFNNPKKFGEYYMYLKNTTIML